MVRRQSSYTDQEAKGCLYLVPTPIGNLQDMTFRALEILKQVDYIAAEDTRQTRKLLNYFQIDKRLVSYHEHNKHRSGPMILADVQAGKQVALVTDAGMPGIADPGQDLVSQAVEDNIPVISLPGANAALTALIASGLSSTPFLFYGFLPRSTKKQREELLRLQNHSLTLIFYEAPHRLRQTLQSIYSHLGDRQGVLVRELTKKHEEYIRGSLKELIAWAEETELRGEFCLIIEGNNQVESRELAETAWYAEMSVEEHVQAYIQQGYSSKEAIKLVARDRELPKREVYSVYHLQKDEGQNE